MYCIMQNDPNTCSISMLYFTFTTLYISYNYIISSVVWVIISLHGTALRIGWVNIYRLLEVEIFCLLVFTKFLENEIIK